ncbi:hypothetical protein KUTeg_001409 [Tegillarca granosa]|uniref:Uncharacterized protein n=1 Tax=Tegillarca granosa TaxID=220873 RepID=A0ABQ9FRB6_TEGGR|nr:hypothetical protein KUTeg_001409 [Tegillarca granosa]
MNRSSSEFSLNTLPDLGSISARNSYAEPILNIISDEPIPASHIGVINNGNRDHEMKVILEKAESKENIYETADGFRNSDSETDSEEESDCFFI